MKISAWHKAQGDEIRLNMPLWRADKTYASILFEWNIDKFIADEYGGPAYAKNQRNSGIYKKMYLDDLPDYGLFNLGFSLGYSFRSCFRKCSFCKVDALEPDPPKHYSIWSFHPTTFKKICLLNNNTFFDSQWKETFEEILDANLIIKDENGYDLRLIDEEKATWLKKMKWDHGPKFAWDRMEDEKEILRGFSEINRVGFKKCTVYILMGYDTTMEQDIYRCQKIHDLGHNPFPMLYKESRELRKFRRMIYARYYRRSGNIEKAWKEYRRN